MTALYYCMCWLLTNYCLLAWLHILLNYSLENGLIYKFIISKLTFIGLALLICGPEAGLLKMTRVGPPEIIFFHGSPIFILTWSSDLASITTWLCSINNLLSLWPSRRSSNLVGSYESSTRWNNSLYWLLIGRTNNPLLWIPGCINLLTLLTLTAILT